jgi:uncharacterized heparinase superfamily protein
VISSNLLRRLRKLQGLPPAVVAEVAGYKASQMARSVRQLIRVRMCGRIEPRGVDLPADGRLKSGIRFFSLNDGVSRQQAVSAMENELGISLEAIRAKADDVCAHRFDLLGSGPVSLGASIDWHRDFKAGTQWERSYFSSIPEVELDNHADIKVPWELSRCYHFLTLGKAYRLTGDEKYAREFVSQFEHWTKENLPYHGVNWRLSMEVAIRAIHWIWGYFFFQESPHFDEGTKVRFLAALAVHGDYIWNNLEFDKRVVGKRHERQNGNHYISNLVGLIYLGIVLPGSTPRQWLLKAMQELDAELRDQVLPGGVHWELSPSYHRLVLEMCLSAVVLGRLNGVRIPATITQRLEAMCEFTMHYTKPDGLCPMVRDADDGRLCWLNGDDFRDHRHVMAVGGVFFDRADLSARAGAALEDVFWLFGPEGLRAARKGKQANAVELPSRAFGEAGYYVLRSGPHTQVFVSCADVGMKGTYGGHAHNDALSFELFHQDTTFITDCGTYNYGGDPEWRNRFRSTAFHNTARVDGCEQNQYDEAELFGMANDARPRVREWRSTPEFDFLSAAHFGYQRLKQPVVHRRDFHLDKMANNLIIRDDFQGRGEHLLEVFIHFRPEVEIRQLSTHSFVACALGKSIHLSFESEGGWKVELRDGWVSERYGKKRPTRKLVAFSKRTVPATLTTTICLGPSADQESSGHEKVARLEKTLEGSSYSVSGC